jgi:hypothetical protein
MSVIIYRSSPQPLGYAIVGGLLLSEVTTPSGTSISIGSASFCVSAE